MLVTLITCTGARPEAFSLCEKYIQRQTYKGPLQWIVVDDGPIPTRCHCDQQYIRAKKIWEPGYNSQRDNLNQAIEYIKGDIVLIIEDDDWYSSNYIEVMLDLMKYFALVGEGNAKYYHVEAQGYQEQHNTMHVSLCQTGFRKELIKPFYAAINSGEFYIDIVLWTRSVAEKWSRCVIIDKNLCIGMKGLPGRTGLGQGHKQQKHFMHDLGFAKLREWVGADAPVYEMFSKLKKNIQKSEMPLSSIIKMGGQHAIKQEGN